MTQQYIDFGTFPDDPDADAIRTAFQKVQNNFNELYATTTSGAVTAVNGGAGVSVNTPTGNVIVSANIACVQVATSSLSIGIGGNGLTTAILSNTSQTLYIDINPSNVFSANFAANSSGGLANITGTLTAAASSQPNLTTAANLTTIGTLGNLTVTGNITGGNLVTANYLTGVLTSSSQPNITTIGNLGNLVVTVNSNLGNLATANFFSGDGGLLSNIQVTSGTSIINGTSNVVVGASSNVNISVAGNTNVITVTSTGANVTGYLTSSGNITATNASLGNAVTANFFIGSGANLTNITGANVSGTVANATYAVTAGTANSVSGSNVSGAVSYATTANSVAGANVSGAVSLATSATTANSVAGANVSGEVANATYATSAGSATSATTAGTVTTNAQPNITSVGTLSSLSVTGNITSGNVNTTGNISAANFIGNLVGNISGNIVVPGSNTEVLFNNNGSAGTSNAFTFNQSSNVMTLNGNIITGNVFANSGTIHATSVIGTLTTNAQPNITSVGTLTGLTVSGVSNLGSNSNVIITGGNANAFLMTNGSGNLSWVSGTVSPVPGSNTQVVFNDAGNFSANSGLTFDKTTSTLSVANITGNLTTSTQANITEVGTLKYLIVGNANGGTGNINALNVTGTHYGAATGLTAIPGANVTGTVANATYATSAGSATTADTLTTNAQPNITSVGTLTSLAVTGNVTSGNLSGANLVSANYLTGTLTTAAQPNITSVGSLTSLIITGNINAGNVAGGNLVSANFFSGDGSLLTNLTIGTSISNGNSNVNIPSANGNVNISASGNANVLIIRGAGVNVAGTLSVTGNANVGNIGATNGVFTNVSGNGSSLSSITGANVTGAVSFATTANAVAGANVTGFVPNANVANTAFAVAGANVTGQVANALVAGTVYTAAQPNITSVGTLSGLTVNGVSNLGPASNVIITGGTSGYILSTNGSGNLSWVNASSTGIAGTNTQVQFNDSGTFGASANFTFDKSTNTLSATNIAGNGAGLTSLTGANVTGNVANANLAGYVTQSAQSNITSIGTLTSLGVSGNITAANITANTGVFTGNGSGLTELNASNISSGTLAQARLANASLTVNGTSITLGGSGTITATASGTLTIGSGLGGTSYNGSTGVTITNTGVTSIVAGTNIAVSGATGAVTVSVSGTVPNATFATTAGSATTAGTVTTAAQPNITSVGTLSSLVVTGNVAAGNLTTTGVLSVTGTGVSSIAGNLDMTSNNIVNLATPVNSTDAATKQYVDDVAQGLHTHDSCNAATQTTLATISGGTVTYSNGTDGVGATLTTTGSYTTIDGVTLSNGMRILVKNEANTAHNGIYDRTSTTVLTRSSDFDTPAEMAGGDFTFVTAGTLYDNTGWVMPDPVTTVGTTAVNWVQFSGAGTYTAGTGLTLTGSQFSVNASQTQITTVGTLGSLAVTGNISAGNVSATTFTGALSGAATTAGTVTTAAQGNITSVGTLTSLGVNGTVTAVAFTANTGVFTGNGSGLTALNASNISSGTLAQARLANATLTLGNSTLTLGGTTTIVAGLASVTSAAFVGALTGAATTAGTVTTAAQPNITSVGTLTGLGVNGTITAVNITANTGVFIGSGANLTTLNASNISSGTLAQARLANSSLTVNGTSISLGGSGTITATATNTLTLGSYLTGTSYNGSSAITAAVDATTTNTANKVVARDANGSFSANIITATLSGSATSAGSATTAGTVTTAAQGNITSVGTLTGLGVNGTITAVNITANTGVFAGSGANLTTLNASNISSGTLAQARLANASLTVNGTSIALGGSGTITATATGTLTIGTGLGGTSYNGSTGVTITNTGVTSIVAGTNISVSGATGAVTVNVSGTVANATYAVSAGSAGSATTAGTVTTAAQPNITSLGTLTRVIVGDGSAASPSMAFASDGAIDTGFYWGGDGYINWTNNGVRRGQFRPDGTAEIGTVLTTALTTGATATAGTITGNWSLGSGSRLNATYADLAEKYTADADYEPGTVLVFGGAHEVTLSTDSDSFRVAGVVTTNPAYTMNNDCVGEHIATIALQGRVPVKVIGPVYKGDLLVSYNNGYAVANNIARAGTIIGKSLENFTDTSGIIEVAVGRF